jgi:hypothetical protein
MYAQDISLQLKTSNLKNQIILKNLDYKKLCKDKKELFRQTDSVQKQLQKAGYLNNEIQNIDINNGVYSVLLKLNEKITSIQIRHKQKIPDDILKLISDHYNREFFEIPFDQTEQALNTIVNESELRGNSFIHVYLDHIKFTDQKASAELIIEDTHPRTIDNIIVNGYEDFPKSFIRYRLHLMKGSTFNLQKMESASAYTKSLGFVNEIKPPEVLFTNDSTFIYLFLEKKKSNTFDGLIGFSSKPEGKGLDFNGYLDVKLRNVFNHGEHISLFWKSNGNDSQQFDLSAALPYLFKSPLSPEISLNIYKQDTTFSNINFNLGIYFDIFKSGKVAALYNSENSTSLSKTDTPYDINSYKKNKYGLNFRYFIYSNDLLFPEKFNFDVNAYYASRKTDTENSNQNIFELKMNYLWKISRKNYLFVQNQSSMINSDHLYTNELFRIGGVNSVRGFNEESIPASAFSIINLEYRYKTNTESYFFALTDLAWFTDQVQEISNNIYGFGLGYSFLTRAGHISLIYALGKFNNKPVDFNNSKLHFKIVNFF